MTMGMRGVHGRGERRLSAMACLLGAVAVVVLWMMLWAWTLQVRSAAQRQQRLAPPPPTPTEAPSPHTETPSLEPAAAEEAGATLDVPGIEFRDFVERGVCAALVYCGADGTAWAVTNEPLRRSRARGAELRPVPLVPVAEAPSSAWLRHFAVPQEAVEFKVERAANGTGVLFAACRALECIPSRKCTSLAWRWIHSGYYYRRSACASMLAPRPRVFGAPADCEVEACAAGSSLRDLPLCTRPSANAEGFLKAASFHPEPVPHTPRGFRLRTVAAPVVYLDSFVALSPTPPPGYFIASAPDADAVVCVPAPA